MSIEAIVVSVNEEPVAGKPHGGFCEGERFISNMVCAYLGT